MDADKYPGLDHAAHQLSAFLQTHDIFIIALKDGSIIRFTPQDATQFRQWLASHRIRDIDADKGY